MKAHYIVAFTSGILCNMDIHSTYDINAGILAYLYETNMWASPKEVVLSHGNLSEVTWWFPKVK